MKLSLFNRMWWKFEVRHNMNHESWILAIDLNISNYYHWTLKQMNQIHLPIKQFRFVIKIMKSNIIIIFYCWTKRNLLISFDLICFRIEWVTTKHKHVQTIQFLCSLHLPFAKVFHIGTFGYLFQHMKCIKSGLSCFFIAIYNCICLPFIEFEVWM